MAVKERLHKIGCCSISGNRSDPDIAIECFVLTPHDGPASPVVP